MVRYQVLVYLRHHGMGGNPPDYLSNYNTAFQGVQEALKYLNHEIPEDRLERLRKTLETDGEIAVGDDSGVHVQVRAFDPLNPPDPPGQVVYIVREGDSPCENVVCAAFSTYERADAWLQLAAKNMGVDPDSLFIDAQVLNMTTPKIY